MKKSKSSTLFWLPYLLGGLGIAGILLSSVLFSEGNSVASVGLDGTVYDPLPPSFWEIYLGHFSLGAIFLSLGWLGIIELFKVSSNKIPAASIKNYSVQKPVSKAKTRHIFLLISCEYDLSPLEPVEIFNACYDGHGLSELDGFAFVRIKGDIDQWLSDNSLVDHVIRAFEDSLPNFNQENLFTGRFLYAEGKGVAQGVCLVIN